MTQTLKQRHLSITCKHNMHLYNQANSANLLSDIQSNEVLLIEISISHNIVILNYGLRFWRICEYLVEIGPEVLPVVSGEEDSCSSDE